MLSVRKKTIPVTRSSVARPRTSATTSRIPFPPLRRLSSPVSHPPSAEAYHRSTQHHLRLPHRDTTAHHRSPCHPAKTLTIIFPGSAKKGRFVSDSVGRRSAGFAFSWSDTRVFECGLYNVRPGWRDVAAGHLQTRSHSKEDGVDNQSDVWVEELHGKRQAKVIVSSTLFMSYVRHECHLHRYDILPIF